MPGNAAGAGQLTVLAAAAICALALLSVAVWHLFPGDRSTTTEAYVYHGFAYEVANGAVPYRDVTIEYPPGALPVFLAPVWLLGSTAGATWDEAATNDAARRYEAALAVLLGGLLAATIAVTAVTLRLLRAPLGDAALALGVQAASPVLLGALPLTRYDAWPVLLTSLAVLAAVAARSGLVGLALGVAASAKLYPLVLLPGLAARTWRDGGRRAVAALVGGAVVAALAVIGPFLALAPSETVEALRLQLARGLQMESLGGSLVAAAWKASLWLEAHGHVSSALPVESCQRCDGLVAAQLTGRIADGVGIVSLLAVVGVLVAVARRASRPADRRAATVWVAATSVTALVVLGKVLSSQFLLWLLPLVPLVGGRRGRQASALLVVAALMTNVWFPDLYRDYVNVLAPGPVAFLLVRNALLVGVLVLLLWPERRDAVGSGAEPAPSDDERA